MAYIIQQINLFDYTQIEILGDLERLKLAIENIDDEKVIEKLTKLRGNGRNDHPIRAMLNSIYAMKIYGHTSIESLRRELSRNPSMMRICGFKSGAKYPSAGAYTNFINNLIKCDQELESIFSNLANFMYKNIQNFGETTAGDGKIIQSYANQPSKRNVKDKRSENDADFTQKQYISSDKSGDKIIKKKTYFGFRMHSIVDTCTELPIAVRITKASTAEKSIMIDMLKNMPQHIRNRMKNFLADKGYDWTELNTYLENEGICPIIDICNKWKDAEATKQYRNTDLVYNYKGEVYFVDCFKNKYKLNYLGYDKSTETLRYGFNKALKLPKDVKENKIFRIKLCEDRRIFVPIARDSKKWCRIYKARTSVERYNGRIDRDLGFEKHNIRGLGKMKTMVYIANILMLGMAKGKILNNQREHLAALTKIA